ncbi:hypothetical protein S83_023485, partial [Arachis hypogaea]
WRLHQRHRHRSYAGAIVTLNGRLFQMIVQVCLIIRSVCLQILAYNKKPFNPHIIGFDFKNGSQTEDESFGIDLACIKNTRMDKRAFHALCNILKVVGKLEPSRNMGVEEM